MPKVRKKAGWRPAAKTFLSPLYPAPGFDEARVVLLPIPYERTTSYGKGTRHGPAAILRASQFLELLDEETGVCPCNAGMFTAEALELRDRQPSACLRAIASCAGELLSRGKRVIAIGGEHAITPSLVEAHRDCPNLSVLQLDAHADLRDAYQGSRHSHACVMRRIVETTPAVQVGIRSLCPEEYAALPSLPTHIYWAHEMAGRTDWMEDAIGRLSANVYVTVDVDALDPSAMPATGTPEPGGMDWQTLIRFLRAVASKRTIVGADVVEFAPIKGMPAFDFTAAKLVYKLVGMVAPQ